MLHFEMLEPRRLLSGTAFPNVLGDYAGTYQFSTGDTGTIQLHVDRQRGAKFWGSSSQSNGLTSSFHGTINRKGNVTFIVDTQPFGQKDKGTGALSANVFNVSEVVRIRGAIVAYGTISAAKV